MFALKSFYVCTETIDWIHVILYVKIVTRLLEYWYIKNLVCIYAILYKENWFYSIESRFRKIPLKDLDHVKYHRKSLSSLKTSILSRFRDNTVNPPSSPSSSHLLISPSSHRLRTSGQALLRQLRLRWSPCALRGQMMRMGRRVTGHG
jgi:hypothetical protein